MDISARELLEVSYREEALTWVNCRSEVYEDLKEMFGDSYFVFLDIGACEGLSSIRYLREFPFSTAIMVEPLSRNCEIIGRNLDTFGLSNRVVDVFGYALGKEPQDKVPFWESFGKPNNHSGSWNPGNKSSSILTPSEHKKVHPWCRFERSFIKMETLDRILKFGDKRMFADFIHIDVQGAELDVFEGGQKTLSKAKMVWMEVSNQELYKGQPLRNEVFNYMVDHGFNLRKDTAHGKPQGDQLWVR